MTTSFLQIREVPGIFVDALVADANSNLLFLSAWGSESYIQPFRAKLSLPLQEGGLSSFKASIGGRFATSYVCIRQREQLVHVTGRPSSQTLFSHLTQLWVYERLAVVPDRANSRGLLLQRHSEDEAAFNARIWQVVQTLCQIPLHPTWEHLLADFKANQWISFHRGFNVSACVLELPAERIEAFITQKIQQGELVLPTTH